MRLVMKMLQAIEKGMNDTNRQFIQFELKDKLDKFVHLLNMSEKKFKNTNITPHDLCIQVLKTLAVLLADNPQTKVCKNMYSNKKNSNTLQILLDMIHSKISFFVVRITNLLMSYLLNYSTCSLKTNLMLKLVAQSRTHKLYHSCLNSVSIVMNHLFQNLSIYSLQSQRIISVIKIVVILRI